MISGEPSSIIGVVYADSAYRGQVFAEAVRRRSGVPHVVRTGFCSTDDPDALAEARRKAVARTAAIHAVRCRAGKIFGAWKRCCGFRRMRWRGLANARLQTRLTATAYNLKRTLNILKSA